MIVIKRQMRSAMAVAVLLEVEADILKRVRQRTPKVRGVSDDDADWKAAIRLAVARADRDGFTGRASPDAYVDAAMDFGIGFATDPMHRWPAVALQSKAPGAERGERLLRARVNAAPELNAGECGSADSMAAGLLRAITNQAEWTTAGIAEKVFRQLAIDIRRLRGIAPDEERRLIDTAASLAQQAGFTGPLAAAAMLVPLVLFGCECAADPRYVWTSRPMAQTPAEWAIDVLAMCRAVIAAQLAAARPSPDRILPNGKRLTPIGLDAALPGETGHD